MWYNVPLRYVIVMRCTFWAKMRNNGNSSVITIPVVAISQAKLKNGTTYEFSITIKEEVKT